MSIRTATVVFCIGLLAGCTYPTPPGRVYFLAPCPTPRASPPPGAVAPPGALPGMAFVNQCLATTSPFPPYQQYYVAPRHLYGQAVR